MSVLFVRLDDREKMYHRTVMLLYTKLSKPKLAEYLGKLELLASDRQSLFFKIDLDIQIPPRSMKMSNWHIVSITLKSAKSNNLMSLNVAVNLFYKKFPHKTKIHVMKDNTFICSGDYNGKELNSYDLEKYKQLSKFMVENQENVVQVSKEFRAKEHTSETVVAEMIELANRYNILGGHWLMFFEHMPKCQYEQIFDYLMNAFFTTDISVHGNRFNAKLSPENLIISIGNVETRSAIDPSILGLATRARDFNDTGVCQLRTAIDRVYRGNILGKLSMKYKPDIISNCCIQRNGIIRPTVYDRSYWKWYESNCAREQQKEQQLQS